MVNDFWLICVKNKKKYILLLLAETNAVWSASEKILNITTPV